MGRHIKNFASLDTLPRTPDTDDFPISYYKELATAGVKYCVLEYLDAIRFIHVTYKDGMDALKGRTGRKAEFDRQKLENDLIIAEATRDDCMRFFKSERFDILMPDTDKKWFIKAVKAKAERTMHATRRF